MTKLFVADFFEALALIAQIIWHLKPKVSIPTTTVVNLESHTYRPHFKVKVKGRLLGLSSALQPVGG
jgi:hypothetical protein